MSPSLFILADFEDVIRALIPIVVVIIWIASQVMNLREKRPGVPRQRLAPQEGGQPKQEAEASIRQQVEQFLRQTAEQQQGQRRSSSPADERQARPAAQAPRAAAGRSKTPPERPQQAGVASAEQAAAEGLASHHLKTHQRIPFDKRLKPLGEQLELTDEKMADHLQKVFDHPVGRLGRPLSEQEAAVVQDRPETPGAQIAAALRDPQNVRQAIVLSEIINRPSDRW